MLNLHNRLRSSALAYAISFMLMVGLVTSGIIFIASANKRLEVNYLLDEHLTFNNYLALKLASCGLLRNNALHVHTSGDSSQAVVKPWGAFEVAVATSFHGNRRVKSAALFGYDDKDQLPALYLPDQSQSLKLAGNTRIEGTVMLPERGPERAYIGGKNYENDQLIYGTIQKSEKHLPALKEAFANMQFRDYPADAEKLEKLPADSVFPFDRKTCYYSQTGPFTITQKLGGNLIVHSFDSIRIGASAQLEHVLIIAPVISIESGFTGTLHLLAHKQVRLESDVRLQYPSTIVLNELDFNDGPDVNFVRVGEDSQVLGGILIVSQERNFRKPVLLDLQRGSVVGGLVYNTGETQLNGRIAGHLYTQNFYLRAGGGAYRDHVLDGRISSEDLPAVFILPHWLKEQENGRGKLITHF